ncbi:MAG: YitT family protein [Firmicutes bacterium]|nr:YitT family protein [Bacillota bacterium]
MKSNKKMDIKQELKTIVALTVAACIMAFNLKSFVQTGGLYPGGFSGLTVLIQRIAEMIGGFHIPYSALYVPLNIIPAFIGFKFISKKFTIYSFYVVFLSGILTDIFPSVTITYDTLLISIFGGIIGSVAISICLISGASGGGTDFISIFFSEKKGIDTWNYILAANIVILSTAGILFGFDKALYSIIYQYTSTQVIQMLFKRYQKDTLFIITELPGAVYGKIREITHHDATLIEATGCFEGAQRNILYSVIGREQVNQVIAAIKEIDPKAFINVINTEQVNGRFYKKPY